MNDLEQKLAVYEKRLQQLRKDYLKTPSLSIILQGRAIKTAIRIIKEKLAR